MLLKELFEDWGGSQKELAGAIGLSQPTICRMLRGQGCQPKNYKKAAEFFGINDYRRLMPEEIQVA